MECPRCVDSRAPMSKTAERLVTYYNTVFVENRVVELFILRDSFLGKFRFDRVRRKSTVCGSSKIW